MSNDYQQPSFRKFTKYDIPIIVWLPITVILFGWFNTL